MDNEREQNLIALAQSGVESARDELLLEYGKLVRTIARSVEFVTSEVDYNDLFQVGNIGLLRAISSFSAEQSASFKTFASHCIRNAMIDELRKKSPLVTVSTTDNPLVNSLPSPSDPEKEYIDKETVSIMLETLRSTLSAEEFEVLRFYLDGLSYQEISSKLDMEKKKVDNTLYGIKKKLKHILN